ncbi:hypothetical protein ACHAXS_010603 [Conticribra weissflogii]
MGINGILPKILPSAGRENYDLRALADGLIVASSLPSSPNSSTAMTATSSSSPTTAPAKAAMSTISTANEGKRHRGANDDMHYDDDNENCDGINSNRNAKRRKLHPSPAMHPTKPPTTERIKTWKRRKFRVAIDIHGWISRAAHGNGVYLLDERHLSYHGRNELRMERERSRSNDVVVENCDIGGADENEARSGGVCEEGQNGNHHAANNYYQEGKNNFCNGSYLNQQDQNNYLQQQQQQQQQEKQQQQQQYMQAEERRLAFIIKCTNFILHRLEYLQNQCQVDILPVLDGKTPPCKRETVKLRANKKEEASLIRDGDDDAVRKTKIPHATSNTTENEISMTDEAAATEAEALRKIAASKRAGATYNQPNQSSECDKMKDDRPTIQQQLTKELLEEFRRRKYPFLQSPYEADGQLAYLSNRHLVDLVITEDSDLIALGVQTLVYRLSGGGCDDDGILEANNHYYNTSGNGKGSIYTDINNGNSNSNRKFTTPLKGTILHRKDLGSSHGIDLLDFSNAMLATMFVAAGCDYCDSLKGIGIVTARNVVKRAFHGGTEADGIYRFGGRRHHCHGCVDDDDDEDDFDCEDDDGRTPVLKKVLNKLFHSCQKKDRDRFLPLRDPAKEDARYSYERSFLRALAMFRHPLVYDPILCRNVISNDVSEDEDDSHNGSDDNCSHGGFRATPSFLKEEEFLMEYDPYRELVTKRKFLYDAVGSPFSPDIARKIAEGLVDPRVIHNTEEENQDGNQPKKEYPHKGCDDHDDDDDDDKNTKLSSTNKPEHPSTQLEIDEASKEASFTYFTQDSHSNLPSSYNSQENFIGGRGTEQSKSTSSGTSTGLISSLSPDLLASPSPVKYYV